MGDLVDQAKSSFASWVSANVLRNLKGKFPWLGNPFVGILVELLVRKLVSLIIDKGGLGNVLIHPNMLNQAQAEGYRTAAMKLMTLPPDSPEREQAEKDANEKFDLLIRVTR